MNQFDLELFEVRWAEREQEVRELQRVQLVLDARKQPGLFGKVYRGVQLHALRWLGRRAVALPTQEEQPLSQVVHRT